MPFSLFYSEYLFLSLKEYLIYFCRRNYITFPFLLSTDRGLKITTFSVIFKQIFLEINFLHYKVFQLHMPSCTITCQKHSCSIYTQYVSVYSEIFSKDSQDICASFHTLFCPSVCQSNFIKHKTMLFNLLSEANYLTIF